MNTPIFEPRELPVVVAVPLAALFCLLLCAFAVVAILLACCYRIDFPERQTPHS